MRQSRGRILSSVMFAQPHADQLVQTLDSLPKVAPVGASALGVDEACFDLELPMSAASWGG